MKRARKPKPTIFGDHLRALALEVDSGEVIGVALAAIRQDPTQVPIISSHQIDHANRMRLVGAIGHAAFQLHATEHNLRSQAQALQPDPMNGAAP